MKFGRETHIGSLQQIVCENFDFLKIKNGGGRHLKNDKNRDKSATVSPMFTKIGGAK